VARKEIMDFVITQCGPVYQEVHSLEIHCMAAKKIRKCFLLKMDHPEVILVLNNDETTSSGFAFN